MHTRVSERPPPRRVEAIWNDQQDFSTLALTSIITFPIHNVPFRWSGRYCRARAILLTTPTHPLLQVNTHPPRFVRFEKNHSAPLIAAHPPHMVHTCNGTWNRFRKLVVIFHSCATRIAGENMVYVIILPEQYYSTRACTFIAMTDEMLEFEKNTNRSIEMW